VRTSHQALTSTLLLVLLWLAIGCSSSRDAAEERDTTRQAAGTPAAADDFRVLPGERVGPVTATSSEAELIGQLGTLRVQRDTIFVGVGEFRMGTTLYKGTPDEAQILWQDSLKFARPELVRLIPAAQPEDTRWRIPGGPAIGTRLKEAEQLNGKSFGLYGFGWDFGGTVSSWNGGKLSYSADGTSYLGAIFVYDQGEPKEQEMVDKVLGDTVFPSSNPTMQQLNPRIYSLEIRFRTW
jgi:hypothetical protein